MIIITTTKITTTDDGKYWFVFTGMETEIIIVLFKNELERIEDQIADILLETLDT